MGFFKIGDDGLLVRVFDCFGIGYVGVGEEGGFGLFFYGCMMVLGLMVMLY